VLAAGTAASTAYSAVLLGLPVLAPVLREEFDLSLTEVGVVLSSVWVGPIFTLLAWGIVADRYGERRSLAVGLAAMGLLVAACLV
jgi:MFS family permease